VQDSVDDVVTSPKAAVGDSNSGTKGKESNQDELDGQTGRRVREDQGSSWTRSRN